MSNIRIPGVLWTVVIALAIWAIETFLAPGYQLYAETAVVVIMGIAKAANLDDKQVKELLAVLRRLQAQVPVQEAAFVEPEIEKHEPNKAITWLVG